MSTPIDDALQSIAEKAIADPDLAFIAAKAAAMVEVYFQVSEEMSLTVEAVEQWYELDVVNPRSGRTRKAGYTHCGFLDGIVAGKFGQRSGRFILERKTCDQDISQSSHYWDRLRLNHQLDEYALAYWQQHGTTVDGIIYDVLRQPGISPRTVTLGELAEISEFGTYFGSPVQNKEIIRASNFLEAKAWYAEDKKNHAKAKKSNPELGDFSTEPPEQPKESPHLFRLRCLAYLRERPQDFFAQRFIMKSEGEILDYADELWTLSELVHGCRTKDTSPRNPGACFGFATTCEYIGLCTGTDAEDSSKWDIREVKHPERLSQSRLACFQSCRRKHFYRYVAGIIPQEKPTTDKQHLGLLVHQALEVLWQSQQQQQIS